MSPRGPFLYRTDSPAQPASGLGPPRSAQPDPRLATGFRQTVDRDSFRRDRSPNGVAWRFPDWTAVGFALPSPFLGSHSSHSPLPLGCVFWVVLGSMHRSPIDSLDAARCITCGDVNPDCFMGLFFSPLVSG